MERYPLFSKIIPYSTFAELKISILDEFLESLLSVNVGNCVTTWGGWLEEVLTYNKLTYNIVRSSVRFSCPIGQIEGNIKKVYNF